MWMRFVRIYPCACYCISFQISPVQMRDERVWICWISEIQTHKNDRLMTSINLTCYSPEVCGSLLHIGPQKGWGFYKCHPKCVPGPFRGHFLEGWCVPRAGQNSPRFGYKNVSNYGINPFLIQ